MDKNEAIDIITKAAVLYEKYFKDKNLLIIYGNKNSNNLSYSNLSFYETTASARNFAHLTGVLLNETDGINAELFYNKAIGKNNNKIFETDFNFRSDNTTFMKLDVIRTALNASENFELCGYFRDSLSHTDLDSDLLVGSRNSSVGFRSVGNRLVPNTLLKGDIRNETASVNSVFAVFQKDRNDSQYTDTVCFAPDVHAQNFLAELQKSLQQYNHQNPCQPVQVHISLNSKQLENDRKIEQKAHISDIAGRLNTARKNHIRNPFDNTARKTYSDTLEDLLDEVNNTELYGYANILLKKQRQAAKVNEKSMLCIEKERGKIQNLHTLSDILKDLADARTDYIQNSGSENAMNTYITVQERLAERAVETDLHDYIIKLLQSQQRENPELVSYIDDDIQAIRDKKLEYDTAPRKMNFSFSVHNNAFRPDNSDIIELKKEHTITITIPPKRPFKALIMKAQKMFQNIADSFHGAEKSSDNTEQAAEKSTSVDNKEKSEEDKLIVLDVYNMYVKHCNEYVEFLNTSDVMNSIELQTGLLFEETALQEHSIQQEQVQVEIKKKSKEIEYGD